MKPHRTVVERGDTCIIELEILLRQNEKWHEYVPSGGDKISVYVKNSKNVIVNQQTITVASGNKKRVSVNMPSNLAKGSYTYDVVLLTAEGNKHTICDEYIFVIKEDDAYAELV